ncbi:PTS sugar transporter subunit IIA [Spiroplasma clarkii]|nr:PTS sugar transporter subunit IIA [Spiroplasma clarkii]
MDNIKVYLDVDITTKEDLFDFIGKKAVELKLLTDANAVVEGFKAREAEGSTAFEDGFAIPHTKLKNLIEPQIIVVRSNSQIEWESMDGKPTTMAIALLIPDNSAAKHLEILSAIAVKLTKTKFKEDLQKAKTEQSVIKLLDLVDANKEEKK